MKVVRKWSNAAKVEILGRTRLRSKVFSLVKLWVKPSIDTKNVRIQKMFGLKIFLNPTIFNWFGSMIFFLLLIFFRGIFFSDTKFFQTKNFFRLSIYQTKNFFGTKIFFFTPFFQISDTTFFRGRNFLRPKSFSDSNSIFLDPKYFWTQIFSDFQFF